MLFADILAALVFAFLFIASVIRKPQKNAYALRMLFFVVAGLLLTFAITQT